MKLLIADKPQHHDYVINGSVINGIDVALFPEGATFTGDETTAAAGIYNVERINGELHVTLGQRGLLYECAPTNRSHDWLGTGEWIDAADYNPESCYIVATSAPEGAEYLRRPDGWTVVLPEPEEEPAA